MTTQTEALKLALEALEKLTDAAEGFSVSGVYFNEELWARKCLDAAYDAMGFAQEALAQPEQEPVGYFNANSDGKWEQSDSNDGVPFYAALPPQPKEPEQEPLEYWNAVEGWVKIDEVREHFDSVGCGTIYKTSGEGRVPLSLCKAQPAVSETHKQEPVNIGRELKMDFAAENDKRLAQPEQEPVAVAHMAIRTLRLGMKHQPREKIDAFVQAICDLEVFAEKYTTPPPVTESHKRKPLSGYINGAGINANDSPHIVFEKLERAIEAAHGIKE